MIWNSNLARFSLVSYTALYLSLNEKRRGVTSRPLAGLDLLHQGRPEVCLHLRTIQVVEFSVSQYLKMLWQITMRPSIKDICNLGGREGSKYLQICMCRRIEAKKCWDGEGECHKTRKNADVFYGWSLLGIGAILYLCRIGFITNCFQTQLCVFLIRTVFLNSLLTHNWSDLLLTNFWFQAWNPTMTITELQLYSTTYFSLTSQVKIAPPSFANLQQYVLLD